jgi:hypothetical protein
MYAFKFLQCYIFLCNLLIADRKVEGAGSNKLYLIIKVDWPLKNTNFMEGK